MSANGIKAIRREGLRGSERRHLWRIAAWHMALDMKWGSMFEALANSFRDDPPTVWSTGQKLYEVVR